MFRKSLHFSRFKSFNIELQFIIYTNENTIQFVSEPSLSLKKVFSF